MHPDTHKYFALPAVSPSFALDPRPLWFLPSFPPALLNLAEYMEHDDKALPMDIHQLSALAAKCHAYAKALHYKELESASSDEPHLW